jgi:hypothetical protein
MRLLSSALCILVCVALTVGVRAEIIDRVLAVVGGVLITQSDATAAFDLGLVTIGSTDDPLAAALSQLTDRQLMAVEVDRSAPPEPSTDEIDRRLQSIRARFQSAGAFEAALTRSGFDETRLRQIVRDQLRIDAYLDQRFSAPPLTPERRAALIGEWVSGLRRRTDIAYLYVPRR